VTGFSYFFGKPSQHWATLIWMKKKLVKHGKNTFLQSDFFLYSGWFDQKVIFWPRKWTLGPKLSDNLTVFGRKLYSGWFDQKVDFWPQKWTLGPKLSKKRIKWNYFFTLKIKSFVPNVFWKTAKYHVPNKQLGSLIFLVNPRNIRQLWYEWKKIWLNMVFSRVKYDNLTVFDWKL
jgi:hypothetical protein